VLVSAVRPLAALLGAGFRRYTTYRAAMFGGAFTNAVFALLRASILTAAVASRGAPVGGYDRAAAITYAWVSQALIAVVEIFVWNELALRVRTGDIAVDLSRPVDLQAAGAAVDLGRAAAVVLPRALPIVLAGAVTFGLALPATPMPYLLGVVSVAVATLLSYACRFAVNLTSFWLLDVRGVLGLYVVASMTLCGLVLPIAWFPPWLRAVAAATPFPSLVQTPADILTAHLSGADAVSALGVQVAWLAVTIAAGRALLRAGHQKLVVQGG
jgi:ABC-2 type transport system permease protein